MVRARFDDLVTGEAFELSGLSEVVSSRDAADSIGILRHVEAAVQGGKFVAGFVGYDAAPGFDPAFVVQAGGSDSVVPLIWFGVFSEQVEVDVIAPATFDPAQPWYPQTDAAAHARAVDNIKEQIRRGWTYQVNLTLRLTQDDVKDPFALYAHLTQAQQGRYNAYLETEEWAVVSASPECFFTYADHHVVTRPMKGTAPRGRFNAEDLARASALVNSPKERAENLMIVDLLRNDLGRVASFGSVSVPELFSLEGYPTVWQLTSTVEATLPVGCGIADIFAALFPCGSVTGAPKASTMRIISEQEGSPRGVYCGAIGVMQPSPNGLSATFAVAIRTVVVDRRTHEATYGVGGGITYDSDAGLEWAEVEAKSDVLRYSQRDFGLFETFKFERPIGFVHLDHHLRRIQRSAEFFDRALDVANLRAELEAREASLPSPARVRLEVGAAGESQLTIVPLLEDATEPLLVVFDDASVDSNDVRLFHKTTDRARYDAASERHSTADDVILWNERGEVTETTRANLAVLLEGRWWTPALECGLLPGIERARLLESGELRERVITRVDVERATALATLSSLRGWRKAVLVAP
jgi:para-aminobenzoate synthetase/4-amino-4-deoxychorismate lyase